MWLRVEEELSEYSRVTPSDTGPVLEADFVAISGWRSVPGPLPLLDRLRRCSLLGNSQGTPYPLHYRLPELGFGFSIGKNDA